jgi:glutathione peroxidase
MTHTLTCLLAFGCLFAMTLATQAADSSGPLAFKEKSITGQDVDLADYKGKVVLIVNVASECGLTPQYEQLQTMYSKYKDRGLVVLGFPCNQFGKQEPGSESEIAAFCTNSYKVTFPLFSKIEVNGSGANPLYKYLTSLDTQPQGKGKIGWNFEKFLVGRNGQVAARFSPMTKPDAPEVVAMIENELAKK